jgi:hypothetical protein
MYECSINVCLPITRKGTSSPFCITVARYNFDPGFHPGEEFFVQGAEFIRTIRQGQVVEGDGPTFNFAAQVLRRRKIVKHEAPIDKLMLVIEAEIADKDQTPEIVDMLKTHFPDTYEDYVLQEEDKS